MSTHFTSLDLIAVAADLDQSSGSRIQGGKFRDVRVLVSSMRRSAVGLGHGDFSSFVVGDLAKELAIDFAQWA